MKSKYILPCCNSGQFIEDFNNRGDVGGTAHPYISDFSTILNK